MFAIGETLREARVRRSIGYSQAEEETRIRAKYLRALEDERFDALPSPTYARGFLRTYADYLGLDGQLYADEYDSRFFIDGDRPRRVRVPRQRRERRLETGIVMAALALIAVVTVVVISAWKLSGSTPPAPALQGARTAAHRPARPTAFLRIQAVSGDSYVEVHRGSPEGQILFEGTLERGSVLPFSGSSFWLTVSSPGNLVISVGGRQVIVPGSRPATLTVTPRGVSAD